VWKSTPIRCVDLGVENIRVTVDAQTGVEFSKRCGKLCVENLNFFTSDILLPNDARYLS